MSLGNTLLFNSTLDPSPFVGLRPQARLCLGPGISREDIKSTLLASGGILKQSVTSVESLCWEILKQDPQPLLDAWTVAVLLESLLVQPGVSEHLPMLRARAKSAQWLRRMARTLLQTREAFAHTDEMQVYLERLEQSGAHDPRTSFGAEKLEWLFLITYWDHWLEQMKLWDRPKLLQVATKRLGLGDLPNQVLPIVRLEARPSIESLEQAFWDALPNSVLPIHGGAEQAVALPETISLFQAHTWDDAADTLADRLLERSLSDIALVMPDQPELRRTLMRALDRRGIPRRDDRDPTVLRYAEGLKAVWSQPFDVRGSIGLAEYAEKRKHPALGDFFSTWQTQWTQAFGHVECLQKSRTSSQWDALSQERLDVWRPLESRQMVWGGVEIFRPQSSITAHWPTVWSLGLSLNSKGRVGDLFLNERERSILAVEFQVFDTRAMNQLISGQWRRWISRASDAFGAWVMDPKEAGIALQALGVATESVQLESVGVWPMRMGSYGWKSELPFDRAVRLPGISDASYTVTQIERYSRCPFIALMQDRWKLQDRPLPSIELPAADRGKILHKAVELLLRDHDLVNDENLALDEVLETAWTAVEKDPEWKASAVLKHALMSKWRSVLHVFVEKERAYRKKTDAKPEGLEQRFTWTESETGTTIRGVLDRYDVHPQSGGLVVMDYKTGGDHPPGRDMVELGYRLQLGVTGLAMRDRMDKPVIAAHFVSLDRTGHRTRGLFMEPWVDKTWVSHPATRKRNVFSAEEADRAWDSIHTHLVEQLQNRAQGIFDARPRKSSECERCSCREVCGEARRERIQRVNGDDSKVSPDEPGTAI